MTKKEFKKKVRFEIYSTNFHKRKRTNALFFDQTKDGFKYMMYCENSLMNKTKLFDEFYDWIVNGKNPQYFVQYKYAMSDADRFKVKLSLSY